MMFMWSSSSIHLSILSHQNVHAWQGNHDVKEITAKRTSETVSNWSILSPLGIAEAEGQKQDNATVNLGHGFEEASTAFSHVPDYDLSFFETFGVCHCSSFSKSRSFYTGKKGCRKISPFRNLVHARTGQHK